MSRKATEEAEKVQSLLHEKFVAQRRKDAASIQTAGRLPVPRPRTSKARSITKAQTEAYPEGSVNRLNASARKAKKKATTTTTKALKSPQKGSKVPEERKRRASKRAPSEAVLVPSSRIRGLSIKRRQKRKAVKSTKKDQIKRHRSAKQVLSYIHSNRLIVADTSKKDSSTSRQPPKSVTSNPRVKKVSHVFARRIMSKDNNGHLKAGVNGNTDSRSALLDVRQDSSGSLKVGSSDDKELEEDPVIPKARLMRDTLDKTSKAKPIESIDTRDLKIRRKFECIAPPYTLNKRSSRH